MGKNCTKKKVRVKQFVAAPTTAGEKIKTGVKTETEDEVKKDSCDGNVEAKNKINGKVIFVLFLFFVSVTSFQIDS